VLRTVVAGELAVTAPRPPGATPTHAAHDDGVRDALASEYTWTQSRPVEDAALAVRWKGLAP
jgi:hypothetical protein